MVASLISAHPVQYLSGIEKSCQSPKKDLEKRKAAMKPAASAEKSVVLPSGNAARHGFCVSLFSPCVSFLLPCFACSPPSVWRPLACSFRWMQVRRRI